MKLRATRYPNNEVRIALYPERLPSSSGWGASFSGDESQSETGETLKETQDRLVRSELEQRESAFNIKSKLDTVPRKPRLSLSRYGRRQILRAGSCFDSGEETERLLLTGTLPGTGNRAHRALSENSSYASKTLTNWLNRRSPGCKWIYTWEFQGRGALHIHCVVEVPLSVARYIKRFFKDEWNRILRAICRKSGVDLYAKTKTYSHTDKTTQADVTVCTREPSRYISKYISKQGSHAKAFGRFPPKTWYQISRSLLRVLRDRTQIYEVEGLSYSQALAAWETTKSVVSRYEIAGSRRFDGAVLSCSAYYYGNNFDPLELNKNMQPSKSVTLPLETVLRMGMTTLERYPGAKSISHCSQYQKLKDGMATGMLSRTQLLTLGEIIQQCLGATWDNMRDKTSAAMWIRTHTEWRRKNGLECLITESWEEEIVTICDNYLTA